MDEQKPKPDESAADAQVRAYRNFSVEHRQTVNATNLVEVVGMLFTLAGFVALVLVPFVEEVTLFNATCLFVIAACFGQAGHHMMSDPRLRESHSKKQHIVLHQLLCEIRDAVKEDKGGKDSEPPKTGGGN